MTMPHRIHRTLMFRMMPLIMLLLTLTCVRSAEIKEVHWGLDGKVVPEHFNPLALLVYNPGPAPFDGALELAEGTIIQQGAPSSLSMTGEVTYRGQPMGTVQFYRY